MKKLVFICILLSCKGFAQQLTLQDAINVALKNSFDIQIAKNNVEINTINNHIGMAFI